ncbi:hypothetical protein B6N60_01592 [Richelia sinica FACHB-800]|uniref:Uncharacterized protein n=1 Tax=Richelia sinica FACHB-800 TaxID=1357546 RepID=A0A975Y479_9NOST|nr:hypothetical protein B6N60_01592 [Richelia sinica FACHB-800]
MKIQIRLLDKISSNYRYRCFFIPVIQKIPLAKTQIELA